MLGNGVSPTSLPRTVRASDIKLAIAQLLRDFILTCLLICFPVFLASSRCILLSVISNRLKVTAAALKNRLSHSHTEAHTFTYAQKDTHTHTQTACEAPSGLKVLSQSSGDTTAVKLPLSPAKVALSHVSQQSISLSLSLSPPSFSLTLHPPLLSLNPLTDTVGHTRSHTLTGLLLLPLLYIAFRGG